MGPVEAQCVVRRWKARLAVFSAPDVGCAGARVGGQQAGEGGLSDAAGPGGVPDVDFAFVEEGGGRGWGHLVNAAWDGGAGQAPFSPLKRLPQHIIRTALRRN